MSWNQYLVKNTSEYQMCSVDVVKVVDDGCPAGVSFKREKNIGCICQSNPV